MRRSGIAQIVDSPSYLLRTAIDAKSLLRDPHHPLDAAQKRAVERAREFLQRAKAGKTILERDDAGLVADVRAIDAYASAREGLREAAKTDDILTQSLRTLDELEQGNVVDAATRVAPYAFFKAVANAMARELSSYSYSTPRQTSLLRHR